MLRSECGQGTSGVVLGIRETLNENRSVTVGAAAGITLLAVLWIVYFVLDVTRGSTPSDIPTPRATTQDTQ